MSKYKPKTQGLPWLELSLVSFNGSDHADRSTPTAFLESYREWKNLKQKPEAVVLADQNRDFALGVAARFTEAPIHATTLARDPIAGNSFYARCPNCEHELTVTLS